MCGFINVSASGEMRILLNDLTKEFAYLHIGKSAH
jgi:hypothetical protein